MEVRFQSSGEIRCFLEGTTGIVRAVEVEKQLLETRDMVTVTVRIYREITRRPRRVATVDESQEILAVCAERPEGIADFATFQSKPIDPESITPIHQMHRPFAHRCPYPAILIRHAAI